MTFYIKLASSLSGLNLVLLYIKKGFQLCVLKSHIVKSPTPNTTKTHRFSYNSQIYDHLVSLFR